MLLPAVAAIVRIVFQRVRKGEKVTAGLALPLDLPRRTSSLLLFPFRRKLRLAILTVIGNMIPGRIIGECLPATLAGLLQAVCGFRRFRCRGCACFLNRALIFSISVTLLPPHLPAVYSEIFSDL